MQAQLVADLAHDLATLRGGCHAPAVKRRLRLRDHLIVFARSGELDFGDHRAVGGVDGFDLAARWRREPFASTDAGIHRLNFQVFQDFGYPMDINFGELHPFTSASQLNAPGPVPKRRPALSACFRILSKTAV